MHLFMHLSYAHKRATSIFIILQNYSYKNRESPRGEHQVGLTDLIHNYMDQNHNTFTHWMQFTSWFCHLFRKQKPAWCWFLIRNFTIESEWKQCKTGPLGWKDMVCIQKLEEYTNIQTRTGTPAEPETSIKKAYTKHVSNCVDLLHRNWVSVPKT